MNASIFHFSKMVYSLKHVLCLLLIGLSISDANAQKYFHGIGGQFNTGRSTLEYTMGSLESSERIPLISFGVTYKATYILSTENTIQALSAYPNINYPSGIEIPLNYEFYFGYPDDSGIFLGVGYSYASYKQMIFDYANPTIVSGPNIAAGFQFWGINTVKSFRVGYTHGINGTQANVDDITFQKDRKNLFTFSYIFLLGM